MTSDEQLMQRYQAGSCEAFGELFSRYRTAVCGFFRRRLAQPARAEDLAQETFLAVVRAAPRWEPRSAFRAWLFGIAYNLLHAERRRAAADAASSDGDAMRQVEAQLAAPAADSESVVALRAALDALEEQEREILLLREYEGLRYDEIAELHAVPVNTVRSRLFRARLALKELLVSKQGVGADPRVRPVEERP